MSSDNAIIKPMHFDFENYESPKHTKNQVKKAGKSLKAGTETHKQLDVFNNWRSSHAYPLDVLASKVNEIAVSIDPTSLLAKRLKRSPSIINKLKLQPSMSLASMQDIAGCRAIVQDVDSVYKVAAKIKENLQNHTFVSENDYIKNPKESGYRGIHLVYRFDQQDNDDKYSELMVEIQVRSLTHHYWATAVETMGAYLRQALKSNQGDSGYLEYFSSVGELFAFSEDSPLFDDASPIYSHFQSVMTFELALNIIEKLVAFSQITQMLDDREITEEADYYIVILNMAEHSVRIESVMQEDLKAANQRYTDLEMRFRNSTDRDIAFVSSKKLNELKETYPNYFSDTNNFIDLLKKVLNEFIQNPDAMATRPSNDNRFIGAKSSKTRRNKALVVKRGLKVIHSANSALMRKKRMIQKRMRHISDQEVRLGYLELIETINLQIISTCKQAAYLKAAFKRKNSKRN
ncbi:putative GTP diphosphokinase [Vibrio chagasii]|nr:putative GTP diphosphokinase [Vibrio chagasii]CAH7139921.1 putative GTP diphosphokinase [Vibrio chagasii]CAH7173982.1 putative GTP diphosphokinase [Vibrio chagasii]CAH7205212.1 putative GTP diphosphokinase [Vibrio chagasii]CAH7253979.1 putative GTP diphosphokinase [Vibrio chagasii]